MSNHSYEMLQYAKQAQASSEAELLRIENHNLKKEIKELKKTLMMAAYGKPLYIEGRKND